MNKSARWWQRPSGRIVAEIDVLCVIGMIAIMTSPALAAVMIPIPLTNFVIDLGDVPPWIGAFVLSITWWEARTARKNATEAKITSIAAVAHIEVVRAQTDGILTKVAALSKSEGKMEGRQEVVAEVEAAKVQAREDKVADAKTETETEIQAVKSPAPSKSSLRKETPP